MPRPLLGREMLKRGGELGEWEFAGTLGWSGL